MTKREEINNALKEAMKSKDEIKVSTLRMVNAAIKDRDIEARTSGKTIDDSAVLSLLQSMVKQRRESLKAYEGAGRADLAGREAAEIAIIEGFMPTQMDEAAMTAAIDAIIKDTGASGVKDMGKVMNELKTRHAGQMDMAKAGAVVKARLG